MKVDLSGEEALKIANNIKKEHFKQTIEQRQENHLPDIWQIAPAFLLVILTVGAIVLLIIQGIPK